MAGKGNDDVIVGGTVDNSTLYLGEGNDTVDTTGAITSTLIQNIQATTLLKLPVTPLRHEWWVW